ncbi:alpha-2-macroglobulin [Planctomycetota bacterium]
MRKYTPVLIWIALLAFIAVTAGSFVYALKQGTKTRGDELFDKKNYKEAAQSYAAALKAEKKIEDRWHCAEREIICWFRLGEHNEAEKRLESLAGHFKGTLYEARGEVEAGNVLLKLPHWGYESGGEFTRGRYKQGIYKQTWGADKNRAVKHLEKARDLYTGLAEKRKDAALVEERMNALFDLAAALSRFSPYDSSWHNTWFVWGNEEDDTVGEQDGRNIRERRYRGYNKLPKGLPVDPQGKAIFSTVPKAYDAAIHPELKMKSILHEIEKLDKTKEQKYAGTALYRRAMLARARFGVDRLNRWYWYGYGSGNLKQAVEKRKIWELKDNEVLTLAGGKLAEITLPADEDILALLKLVASDYPDSGMADEAAYAAALYHQTRKQFTRSLEAYAGFQKDFPQSKWKNQVTARVNEIRQKEVRIENTSLQLPGLPPKVKIMHRNTDKVSFKAYPLDVLAYIRDGLMEQGKTKKRYYNENPIQNIVHRLIREGKYKGYIGKVTAEWSASVKDDGTYRYANTEIECPLKKRGAYVIEALLDGGGVMSRNILMLQDTAIVEKDIKDRKLYYVCDAVTGKPLSDMKLDIYSYSYNYDYKAKQQYTKFDEYARKTGPQGLLPFKPRTYRGYSSANVSMIASDADGRLAFHGFSYWNHYYNPYRPYSGTRAIVITDRPVYRPAQKVKFKVWGRHMQNGAYLPASGPRSAWVEIRDPKGNKLLTRTLKTDANGGVDGELELKEDAALGRYYIQVRLDGQHANTGGNYFQVEEYKKPEFEVSVEAAGQVKLGETFEALIKADYYFGAPVTDATVTYKVFREEFSHRYFFPAYWDWLYGSYYGIYWYDCDWFPWWSRWGSRCMVWYPWWGNSQLAQRDLITVGEGELDEKGELKIKIDTAKVKQQFGDVDHVYTVKAEVKDKSRRTIEGQGKIRVTRNEFTIFMQPESGYSRTGETVKIKVRALTPDNTGKKTEGRVSIARIVYRGENNSIISEKPVKEFSEATDDQGNLELALTFDKSGQYKVEYATMDGWGEAVKGVLVIWAVGDDFDGTVYRFNSLELLTDKRTYKVGETAHVMLNAARAGAWVLFADRIENGALLNYRVIELKGKSKIIDIPITKGGVPNFFIEATAVFDGKLHTEVREICVPPEQGMLNVAVTANKQEYRPGAKGTLNVTLTDLTGEPVQGEVCLAAFDKSVLYIQPELTPDMKKFFYGQKRYHNIRRTSNLLRVFNSYTSILNPSMRNLYQGWVPDAWFGSWGARHEDWRVVGRDNLSSFGRRGAVGGAMLQREAKNGLAEAESPALAMDAAKPASAPMEKGKARKKSEARADTGDAGAGGGTEFKQAETRTQFADTALWRATVATDAEGKAKVEMTFPENLTTWKINCFGMTPATQVGTASTSAITTKKFILRLQAPRFFVERDEVVLSANVHNYLNSNKTARVSLDIPTALMELLSDKTQEVEVAAGGEVRVDWLIRIKREGEAVIKMSGLTDEESDAVQMKFPVYVHGMDKMVAQCGSIAPDDKGSTTLDLVVPEERDPSKSRLEVRFSPSLAGAMLDALPFLVAYPYGCTEQTVSRFVPTVLTRKTLQEMGMNLSDIKNTLTNLNSQQLGDDKDRLDRMRRKKPYYYGWANNPVFDDAEVDRMISVGLKRIYNFQHGNGSWGWWAGDRSNPYLSAYVLFGLLTARDADVAVQPDVITRGLNYLNSTMITDIEYFKKHTYKANPQAFACWVLSMAGKNPKATLDILYTERDFLSVYGKSLLSLALWKTGDKARANTMLQNVLQYVEEDDENETAWLKTSTRGWWYWWNSDIESNALLIKAMTAQIPKDKRLPRMIKWLLNNRRHGSYWRSTRDTALCVSGMADYIRVSGESKPDYTLNVEWDGKVLKKIKINKDNFFTFDNKFVIAGDALSGGKHKLRLVREGQGALYYSAYLNYFTKEEDIKGTGLEIKVKRSYYKLDRVVQSAAVLDTSGNQAAEKRLRYTRTKLENGAQLKSGDLLEIELLIESKNDYDYLAFEDMKPAGCEPVALRSGYTYGELCSNMELRDEKVVFFIAWLNQGKHLLKYRMRAEIPGKFHALPTRGFAMYAPELKCNSDEIVLKIAD